jgi:ATP-binding cassette subfamily F protein 3
VKGQKLSTPIPQKEGQGGGAGYAEHKEQQKRLRKAEKAVEDSERKINDMEQRLKELDSLLMIPENASNMELVTEYTTTKSALDKEVERWEQLSEEVEKLIN